ncbi:MAG: hypothetical protein NT128_02835 [Proteobacteria bacterium]|nr:hypothetical protein [Pseudomonadota bacterium]
MKHRNFFLKFVVTIALAGSTYSAEESLFDLFSSQADAQLDSKSRGPAPTTARPSHPTIRISLETNIDYEYLRLLYLKEVESIRFFVAGRRESIICELRIKDINKENSDDERFNLNEALPMPDDFFKIAYQLMRNNKPIAPSVFLSGKNQVSLICPYNASMQWISAIRLGAALVGDEVCFTLFGCKYGESIPTFGRASLSLADPGLSNDLTLLRVLKKTMAVLPIQYNSQNLEETYTTYLTISQLHYGRYFCAQDHDQVVEFFRTYGIASTSSSKAILENCFRRILDENTKKMQMVKPYLVFLLTSLLAENLAGIVSAYYG